MHPVRRGVRPLTIATLATALLATGPAALTVTPASAAAKKATKAKKAKPVRCHAGGQAARPGETLVVITTVRNAETRKVVERRSAAYSCGTTGAWEEINSPTAGVSLIPTSIVVERTEVVR